MGQRMNDIEISVYIPNYNYGEYLDKAIKSLLKQTFKRFEIIIIDDGSTDRSSEVIKKYTSQKNYKILTVQKISLSKNLTFLSLSGEVFCEYSIWLKQLASKKNIF